MTKEQLFKAVEGAKSSTREALQTIYNALNRGQQKQIIKEEKVFDLYGVEYSE